MTFHKKLMTLIAIHSLILLYVLVNHFDWKMLLIGIIISKIFNAVGNEVGLHRLWSHKSFTTKPWKEIILHFFAVPLLYGSSIAYIGVHRQHHAYADTEKDPHVISPWWKAFFYFRDQNFKIENKFVSDLIKNPTHRWVHKNYFKINTIILLSFLLIFGIYYTGWILSYMVVHNFIAVGLVNLLGHYPKYGTKPFDTKDNSTNNAFLKWFTWSEGYHNHHHYNPKSYTFVVNKGEFDFPAILIEKFFILKHE
jgi:stearoyl-CoA desaturase (delta-9 desaturase)